MTPTHHAVKRMAHVVLLVLAAFAGMVPLQANAQIQWGWINPAPSGNAFRGVAFGNATFVAVGDQGTIATSPDGAHWQARESGTDAALQTVIFANSQFTAAAVDGTILSSADGIAWTVSQSGATFPVTNIAFGNGTYVMAGDTSAFMTSPDAVSWTPHTLPWACDFNDLYNGGHDIGSLVFANSRFVAAYSCVLTSLDGVNWSRAPDLVGGPYHWSLSFLDGDFTVTNGPVSAISTDGMDWQSATLPQNSPLLSTCNSASTCIGSNPYQVVPAYSFVVSKDAGATWNFTRPDFAFGGNSLNASITAWTVGNDVFVIVGAAGMISYSTDGVDWMSATHDLPDVLRAVASGNDLYVAVGDRGTVQTSSDGDAWNTLPPQTSADLHGIGYFDSQFVAVGTGGAILTSPDGSNWTSRDTPVSETLHSIAHAKGHYVVVGSRGTILRSADLVAWQSQPSGTASTLRSITFAAGQFVAAGDSGTIVVSDDGAAWSTAHTSTPDDPLFAVAYGSSQFVALGARTIPLYSADGVHWHDDASASLVMSSLAMTFADGLFTTPNESFAYVSNSGMPLPAGAGTTALHPRGIAFGPAGFVAVGDSGLHYRGTAGSFWNGISVGSPNGSAYMWGIAAGDGMAMAVGYESADAAYNHSLGVALLSEDQGSTWKPLATDGIEAPTAVAYHSGKFVLVGNDGRALVRESGNWVAHDTGMAGMVEGLSFANDRFIALGSGGAIGTSLDGSVWTTAQTQTAGLYGAAYGNGTYVAVGEDFAYSTDGAQWTIVPVPMSHGYTSVAFGKGKFIAVGGNGISISDDGVSWTSPCPSSIMNNVLFAGGKFIATGTIWDHAGFQRQAVFVSFDGLDWERGLLHVTDEMRGLAYTNGNYLAVSLFGGIQQSADDLIFSATLDGTVCPKSNPY